MLSGLIYIYITFSACSRCSQPERLTTGAIDAKYELGKKCHVVCCCAFIGAVSQEQDAVQVDVESGWEGNVGIFLRETENSVVTQQSCWIFTVICFTCCCFVPAGDSTLGLYRWQ